MLKNPYISGIPWAEWSNYFWPTSLFYKNVTTSGLLPRKWYIKQQIHKIWN